MNRILTIAACILVVTAPLAIQAQHPYANMTPEQIKAMQQSLGQGAVKMQNCFAEIGMEPINRVQKKGMALKAEIDKLCAAGKHDAAQAYAMKEGTAFAQSDDMKALRKCGKQAEKMLDAMPSHLWNPDGKASGKKHGHVCDK